MHLGAALPFYKCSDAEMLDEACFSDTDHMLDTDNNYSDWSGENGIIPNTFTGPDLLVYFSQLSDLNTVQR